MKKLGSYLNGNYYVIIYDDGSKEKFAPLDTFIPAFPESMDITISTKCNNNCGFCYLGCSPEGEHCDFSKYYKILDRCHPYTEIAINGNSPFHPELESFLKHMKEKKVIVNMTVNQTDFEKNITYLKRLTDEKLIWGLGISLVTPTQEFISNVKHFPNAILHVINGIFSKYDFMRLANHNLKMLILGYKHIGRGVGYYDKDQKLIKHNQDWLYSNLKKVTECFKVVSFDNLAIEQLDVKKLMSDEEWETFYQGDEGTLSFFLNLVDGYFAENSMSDKHYLIDGKSIDEMFKSIRKKVSE